MLVVRGFHPPQSRTAKLSLSSRSARTQISHRELWPVQSAEFPSELSSCPHSAILKNLWLPHSEWKQSRPWSEDNCYWYHRSRHLRRIYRHQYFRYRFHIPCQAPPMQLTS